MATVGMWVKWNAWTPEEDMRSGRRGRLIMILEGEVLNWDWILDP